jgi:hypothetical protein
MKSANLVTYSLIHEITYQDTHSGFAKSHVCRIDIDDYRGKEPSQILGGWKMQKLDSIFSCTSVIFLVDLFDEPPHSDDTQVSKKVWDTTRVQKHLAGWPPRLVRSVISMARPGNLKYMCLFVNKIDLLRVYPSEKASEIYTSFQPIDEALSSVSAGALYERIIGSAEKDIGVAWVLNRLVEISSPAGPGP